MPQRAHVFVSGRVQGVGFRASTRREAIQHDVDGWVKNLPDGRVEAVFEGEQPDVETLVTWCESGPKTARVDDISVEWGESRGYTDFEIRR
jgi:acylphosphatase